MFSLKETNFRYIIIQFEGENMTTENKKLTNLTIVSIVSSIMIFIWFTLRPGLLGTFHWHVGILSAYIILLITVLLPIIFGIIHFIKQTKTTRILLKIFALFTMILWIVIYIGLTILAAIPVNKKNVNFISHSSEIPVKENPTENEPLARYAITSDPHWGSGKANAQARSKILKAVNERDYDALICLGDISEVGMITSMYQQAVDDMAENLGNTPVLLIPGNHDGIVNGIPAFKKNFTNKGDKLYFRMDNGKIHMIFLYMIWDDIEFSKKQEKWLIQQLEEIPQEDTVIVLSHCYITGSGYWDDAAKKNWGDIPTVINRLCPILEKYNVDLALSGHNHFFESLNKDGVDYMILGSMGGKLDENIIYNSPYSQWINNTDYGWLEMKVYKSFIRLTVFSENGQSLYTKNISTKN